MSKILLSKTYTIRAVTRDPSSSRARDLASQGIEVVSGDPSNKTSLDGVFRGAHTVFAMTTSNYDGEAHKEIQYGKDLVDAAIARGIQYYIWSTLPSPNVISSRKYTKVTGFDDKPMPPSCNPSPADTKDGSYVIARRLRPSTKLPLVDIAGDTGKFVAAILAQPDNFQGKTFSGATRLYSMEEQAAIISAATGKDVKYVEVSQDIYRSFLPPAAQDELLQMMLYQQEFGHYGPQTEAEVAWSVENARGSPTSFEEFLSKHPLTLE
ncbi:NmrA domain-containing protein [Fusarium keratoplasticum]|uniref:NmrA domain-containing protein n=1 Tax=Fusarium keratoplasticum TaxID=1328300 RepID=A0ACC0QFA5_9HYPO|nr:NmrA domain-containing protein [Fusarium keratoplasticum]KAI8651040.1 NmrA domain-containing protein [Fusarium keratoplasticum]